MYRYLLSTLQTVGALNWPTDPVAFLAEAPAVGVLPDPHMSWALLGLLHYRQRKLWAWQVYRKRLRSLERRSLEPTVYITDVVGSAAEGIIPGLPDWAFTLDGNDSFLLHRGTAEKIHIDTPNSAEDIYQGYYVEYYSSHRQPGPAEGRLAELFPEGAGLPIALGALRRATLLRRVVADIFVLCPKVTNFSAAVEKFLARWLQPENRVWLAAAIGDWPAAHEAAVAAGQRDFISATGRRAELCRRRWLGRLRRRVSRRGLSDDLLPALAHAQDNELPGHLDRALGDVDLAHVALDVIADDRVWCTKVFALLTEEPGAARHYWDEQYALYLGRHRHRVQEVIDYLVKYKRPAWDVLIEVALAEAPDRLLRRFLRRALRSRCSDHRLTAAAVLAIFDRGWTRRELISVLERSESYDATVEIREALRLSGDPAAVGAVDRWEAAHPEDKPSSLADSARMYYGLAFSGCKGQLLDRMQELADRVTTRTACE